MNIANRTNTLLMMSLALGLIHAHLQVAACSVPVFRYALERWAPDIYQGVVFHDEDFSDDEISWLAPFMDTPETSNPLVNLNIETMDVNNPSDPNLLSLWEKRDTPSSPSLMVSYPQGHYSRTPFWTAPFNEENIRQITDSPARREIARRLLKGESAVWVLLESGNVAKDQLALNRLTERLDLLNDKLELPALDPADIEDGFLSIEEEDLKIAFSTLSLSRKDPQESFFIQMLLGTEDDLKAFDEPMAFPIFGRGRALYALIGEGISDSVIEEACVFLTGACSCEVKEQNPGVDLLMSVDWDHLVTRQFEVDRELPPLTGFVTLKEPAKTNQHPESPQAPEMEPKPDTKTSLAPPQDSPSVLLTTAIACAIIGAAVLLGGFFFLSRK